MLAISNFTKLLDVIRLPSYHHLSRSQSAKDCVERARMRKGITPYNQSQKNHGSVVALLPGNFVQIRKVFASKHIFAQKRPVGKETVRTIQNLSRQSRSCPDNPELFQTIQKLSGQSTNCPDNLETVWII